MRAISKFKSLLSRDGAARKSQLQNVKVQPSENEPDIDLSETKFKDPTPHDKESTAEFANRILEERRKFFNPTGPRAFGINRALAGRYNISGGPLHPLITGNTPTPSTSSSSTTTLTNSLTISPGPGPGTSDQNQHQQQQQQPQPPPHLGIGTGGVDTFSINPADLPPADHVSESPTMVDFNIYDNAFEDEIARIKRSASISSTSGGRRNSKATGERRGTGTTGTIYHTRLNKKRHDTTILGSDGQREVDEDRAGLFGTGKGKSDEKGAAAAPRGLWQPRAEGGNEGKKGGGGGGFAGVVARAMEGAKEVVVGGGGTEKERKGGMGGASQ